MPTIPTLNGSGITSAPSYLADGTPAGCHVRSSYRRPEGKATAFDLSTEDARNKARMNDYFVNAAARSGWGTPSITEATDYELVRLSYDYWLMITLYQNHWICGKIVDTPAGDMVSAWPRITSEMKPKEITKIDACIRKTHVKQQVLEAIKWARLFGGSGAMIIIEGQEGSRFEEPLDLDSIPIGGFRGLIPFDRWSGIQPLGQLSTDITKPAHFNLPEYYEVWSQNGGSRFRVHCSRILRFTGPTVPQPEYQAMNYWGISVYERVYEELRKRDNMSWNILNLTYRANLIGMKVPILDQMLSGLGMNQKSLIQFQAIMQAQNQAMSNQSMLLLPKDGEMTSMQYAFSGVSEVYEQFQREIAGAAEMPVTLLYGDTKGGLNQTNDADFRIYANKIKLYQENSLRPQLEGVLYPVICMSVLGYVPDDIDLRFPSILTLDDKEKADLAKAQGDTIVGYFNAGIYTKQMALKDIKQTSDVTEIGTNISEEDIAAAEEQEAEEAEMRKLMPAGPDGEEQQAAAPGKGQDAESTSRRALKSSFAGIPITVEYRRGDRRTLRNDAGEVVYDRLMVNDYGFINGTVGLDGDEVDVIVGPDQGATNVYSIFMRDLGPDVDKRQDEDKVCLGFTSESDARNAFLAMYPPSFLADVETIPLETFKEQLDAGVFAGSMHASDAFNESEHPRGAGEKGGQFVAKGGGGGSAHKTTAAQVGKTSPTVKDPFGVFAPNTVKAKVSESLSDGGWHASKDLKDLALKHAVTDVSVYLVLKELKLKGYTVEFSADKHNVKVLPPTTANITSASGWKPSLPAQPTTAKLGSTASPYGTLSGKWKSAVNAGHDVSVDTAAKKLSDTNWVGNMPSAAKEAILHYTGSSYGPINTQLRQNKHMDASVMKKVFGLDKALSAASLPEDAVVYRGFGGASETLMSLQHGNALIDNGFVSTSIDPLPARSFGDKSAMARVLLPKGLKAAYVANISNDPTERELLVARGTLFTFVSKEISGGKTIVTLQASQPQYDIE